MNCTTSNAIFSSSLCGATPIWDDYVAWWTPSPDLSPCLLKLLLGIIPGACLITLAPISLWKTERKKIPLASLWSPVNSSNIFLAKLMIGIILWLFVAADLILTVVYETTSSHFIGNSSSSLCLSSSLSLLAPIEFLSPLLLFFSLLFSLFLTIEERRRFLKNSAANCIFYAALTIIAALMLQHVIRWKAGSGGSGGGGSGRFLTHVFYTGENRSGIEDAKLIIFYIIFSFSLLGFCLYCFPDLKNQPYFCENPREKAGLISKLTFFFLGPLIMKARKKKIQITDVGELPKFLKVTSVRKLLDKHMPNSKDTQEPDSSDKSFKTSTSFNKILLKCFWPQLLLVFVLRSIPSVTNVLQPIILDKLLIHASIVPQDQVIKMKPNATLELDLINYSSQNITNFYQMSHREWLWKGIFYSSILLILEIGKAIFFSHSLMQANLLGMRVKTTIVQAIFHKSLRLVLMHHDMETGQILNLMSVDALRYLLFIKFIFSLIWGTIEIILCCYLMWLQIGVATFCTIGCLLLMFPLNYFFGKLQVRFQKKNIILKDERVKLLAEIFHGVKILKLYAWEKSIQKKILQIREKETKYLLKSLIASASVSFMFAVVPMLMAIFSFTIYVLISEKNILTAETTFVTLSLINVMRKPLYLMPQIIKMSLQILISGKRIEKFLKREEVKFQRKPSSDDKFAIQVSNAKISRNLPSPKFNSINLKIPRGALVCIVGSVGSGKSSLLSLILGEIQQQEGEVLVNHETIAYVSQQPWIFYATLRNNILFGKEYKKTQYDEVLRSCALLPDIEMLAAGDTTEIGENGVNISGGQKARVALARAAYANKETYILDDPLCAVDAHVGQHLFTNLLGPNGSLRHKTRVMVTNSTNFLQAADIILGLKDGGLKEIGKYDELIQNPQSILSMMTKWREKSKVNNMEVPLKSENDLEEKCMMAISGKLLENEAVLSGNVSSKIFSFWFRHASWKLFFGGPFFFAIGIATEVSSTFWLSNWTEEPNQKSFSHFIAIYTVLALSSGILIMMGTFLIFIGSVTASRIIHMLMTEKVIRAPMEFFETVTVGRIINRFSKDMEVTDDQLPQTARDVLNGALVVISSMITISIISPYMLIIFFILTCVLLFIQRVFLKTSNQLKRVEAITKSPVYSKFDETLKGLVTIRAFQAQQQLVQSCYECMDINSTAWLGDLTCDSWIIICIQSIGGIIQYFTAVLTLLNPSLTPGLLGVSLSYSFLMNSQIQWLMIEMSVFESHFVALERIAEYCNLSNEPLVKEESRRNSLISNTWPTRGDIEFRDSSVRYRNGLDLTLKGINLRISDGERIGVVGRTGSGKSTLAMAIFRILEAETGSIIIDGKPIESIDLERLRSSISIIPQHPVVFSGSLRFNVDPFDERTDEEVRRVLELAHLNSVVDRHPEGINFQCSESGGNLSVGQRQLVCLARALMRRSKILVLDEATASVDEKTDALIQETIRNEFSTSTIIAIAHRINTIFDYDKILVLDEGKVVEFDKTEKLLNDRSSAFYSLVNNCK